MRNRRTVVVLAVAFVGLLAAVILQGRLGGAPAPTATPAPVATLGDLGDLPLVFGDFQVQEIRRIVLAEPNGDAVLALERSGDGWTAPDLEGDIAPEAASGIAGTVVVLPYLEVVPTSPETNLAAYGFVQSNTQAMQIVVELLDGEQHTIFLGGATASGSGFYAIVDQRPGFYVLDARAIAFLRQQLRNPPTRLTTD